MELMPADAIMELHTRALELRESGLSRREAFRALIDEVQACMEEQPDRLPAHPFPLEHEFADGIYRRTIHSPAGTLIVGFRHRFSHFFELREGDISILTEDGPMRVQAPFSFKSPAGSKRIVFHHTDVVITTFHATTSTDVSQIELELIEHETPALEHAGQENAP
jgi:hypothetical protein